jgi:hypothetical protein
MTILHVKVSIGAKNHKVTAGLLEVFLNLQGIMRHKMAVFWVVASCSLLEVD